MCAYRGLLMSPLDPRPEILLRRTLLCARPRTEKNCRCRQAACSYLRASCKGWQQGAGAAFAGTEESSTEPCFLSSRGFYGHQGPVHAHIASPGSKARNQHVPQAEAASIRGAMDVPLRE